MQLVIVMDGGLIQGVFADTPECRYAVIDLDVEDLDRKQLSLTPYGEKCLLSVGDAECDPAYVAQAFEHWQHGGVPPGAALEMVDALAAAVESHDNWRQCSDTREALAVWSETAERARGILTRLQPPEHRKGAPGNG